MRYFGHGHVSMKLNTTISISLANNPSLLMRQTKTVGMRGTELDTSVGSAPYKGSTDCTIQNNTTQHNTLQHNTNTTQLNTIHHNTTQHNPHRTKQHSTMKDNMLGSNTAQCIQHSTRQTQHTTRRQDTTQHNAILDKTRRDNTTHYNMYIYMRACAHMDADT